MLVDDDAGVESKRDKVTFIFNFFEELERGAPAKGAAQLGPEGTGPRPQL